MNMSDENKKIEDTKEPKVERTVTAQDFANEYKSLCDKLGFQIVASPVWIARDDGSFSLLIQYSVGKTPKQA